MVSFVAFQAILLVYASYTHNSALMTTYSHGYYQRMISIRLDIPGWTKQPVKERVYFGDTVQSFRKRFFRERIGSKHNLDPDDYALCDDVSPLEENVFLSCRDYKMWQFCNSFIFLL